MGDGLKNTPYQLFMLVLCVAVLVALALEAAGSPGPETRRVLMVFDTVAAVIFMGGFFRSLHVAADRKRYLITWGWVDFLSSIPSVAVLRWGRAARVARLLRILRGARSVRLLGSAVLARRAESAFLCAVLVSMLTVFFGAVAILEVEAPQGGNIRTAGDALWWTAATISTAGFGDLYPVTAEGRAIAAAIMFVGIALFGTVTALFATWLLQPEEEELERQLEAIRKEVGQLRTDLRQPAEE